MSTGDFILSYRLVLRLNLVGFIQLSLFCKCKELMPKLNYILNGESVYWLTLLTPKPKITLLFFEWFQLLMLFTAAFLFSVACFCFSSMRVWCKSHRKPQKIKSCAAFEIRDLNILEVGEELFRWFTSLNVKADKWGIERENEDMSDSWNRAPGLGNGPKWMGELQERLGDRA